MRQLTHCLVLGLWIASTIPSQHVAPYGAASPGSGGFAPWVWVQGEARVGGSPLSLTVARGRGGASTVVALSPGSADLAVGGIRLLVDPSAGMIVAPAPALSGSNGVPGVGTATLGISVPNVPQLIGGTFHAQWVVLDPGAVGGLAASDGLRVTLRGAPAVVGMYLDAIETRAPNAPPSVARWTPACTLGGALAVSTDGRLALAGCNTGANSAILRIFDLDQSPPQLVTTVPLVAFPQVMSIVAHPREPRALVVVNDGNTGTQALFVCDIDRGSPTFGTMIARLTEATLISRVHISADGRRMIVCRTLPPAGAFSMYDVEPGSATQYRALYHIGWGPFGIVDLSPDATRLYLPTFTGMAVLDAATGTEIARAASGVGSVLVDPRGRFALILHVNIFGTGLLSVDLRPERFLTVTTLAQTGLVTGGELSADGSTVLLINGSGYQTYDTSTGALLSTVNANGLFAAKIR